MESSNLCQKYCEHCWLGMFGFADSIFLVYFGQIRIEEYGYYKSILYKIIIESHKFYNIFKIKLLENLCYMIMFQI